MATPEWSREGFTITCDPARIDHAAVHAFLSGSYWAANIPRAVVDRSIDGSLCFALLEGKRQAGFARVVTDRATFAYLGDVYVLSGLRGQGLGKWLIDCVMKHPELQGLRRWMLVTRDAHDLYAPVGFTALKSPDRHMERHDAEVYSHPTTSTGNVP